MSMHAAKQAATPEGIGPEARRRDTQAQDSAQLHGPVVPLFENLQAPQHIGLAE